MKEMQRLRDSKKAIMLMVALINLNVIFFLSAFFPTIPIQISTQMMTAILFLVGIYVGCQSGIDYKQINQSINSSEDVRTNKVDTRIIGNQKDENYRI